VQLSDIPTGRSAIRTCNTPAIRAYCQQRLGMDVTEEATYPTSVRRIPLSEGIIR